jgi:type II secretory pathway component PulF
VEGSGCGLFEFLTNNLPRKIEVTKIVVSVVVVVTTIIIIIVIIIIIITIIIMALTRSCSNKNFGSKGHAP